ncbi:replication-associated recombination protein A [Eubacteriales bacterium OttesenSCG-928-M02]|nr:replication-associated recombination protein A [Eubacteriales bacterium OttesenSCG-928-M02]
MDLFSAQAEKRAPLADRMRPKVLDDFIGQKHIIGKGTVLYNAVKNDALVSSIFYGPPGSGKTTLASIIANTTKSKFIKINAVSTGVKEMREIIQEAEDTLKLYGVATVVLLDECHRWSKSQSDTILPAIESGTIKFIGSTTENPMISMTPAIVSRCRIFQFHPLEKEDILTALERAVKDEENGYGSLSIKFEDGVLDFWASAANGDARTALNALELAVGATSPDEAGVYVITETIGQQSIQQRMLNGGDDHYYNVLSAFCKSLRGGDSDAALAWYARLIYMGADARIIARRLIAHASEDIGLANPNAMVQAVTAAQSVEFIGMPEASLSLCQAIIYLCESPKSNSVLIAREAATADVKDYIDEPVPMHLRDTSYFGADKLGSGKGYQYPHNFPGHVVEQQYMPDSLVGRTYYVPSGMGQEANILKNHQAKKGTPVDGGEE